MIQFETGPNPSAPAWHGRVVKNPAWLRIGQIALYLIRPRISPDSLEVEGSYGKDCPYVVTEIPCGDSSGDDLELYLKMQAAPPVLVATHRANCFISHSSSDFTKLLEIEASCGKDRLYVVAKIPCGDGSGDDLELYSKMQAAPPV